ncbi:MAG: T9SS type A sorting domain-containing protein, partial [Bacteroidota bacterium]
AIGVTGVPDIAIPFLGWNLTDDEKMEMLVVEPSPNRRWDPGERIVFRTPQQYRQQVTNTHAEIRTTVPFGTFIPPDAGDTNFVSTTRPLLAEDRYLFTTSRSAVVDVEELPDDAGGFALLPNYPNPFNPATTITYAVPRQGKVQLRVYDVLGRIVATLVDEVQPRGRYRVAFDGTDFASGVYFSRLEFSSRVLTRKMILVK